MFEMKSASLKACQRLPAHSGSKCNDSLYIIVTSDEGWFINRSQNWVRHLNIIIPLVTKKRYSAQYLTMEKKFETFSGIQKLVFQRQKKRDILRWSK